MSAPTRDASAAPGPRAGVAARLAFPLLLGLVGGAILVALGLWQLGRADQKDAIIAAIEARIAEAPSLLPEAPDPAADRYRPVTLDGVVDGPAVALFDTWRGFGAGVRAVVPLRLDDGRRVMVDLGAVPWAPGTDPAASAAEAPAPGTRLAVEGNLDWPEEARDPATLAAATGAAPVLVIARAVEPAGAFRPLSVTSEGIPDNHLAYAVQWFGLALVWLGMTALWAWRITRGRPARD